MSHPAFGSGARGWFSILQKNKFAVHPFSIPKTIFISITILLGIPFRWYERKKYQKPIHNAQIKNPVFIIGHPRSGTTFLHYLMSRDRSFAYCTTYQAMIPHLFITGGRILNAFISKALPSTRPMDNLKMGINQPKEEEFALAAFGPESMISGYYFPKHILNNFNDSVLFKNNIEAEKKWKSNFIYFLKKLSYINQEKQLLLKSPANTGRIKQILDLFPDAKFIHIYRNPFDVFQSNIYLYNKLLPLLSFQNVADETLEEFIFQSYEALYKKFICDKNLIPEGNLVEIKFEDFELNPIENLKWIYEKAGLSGFEEALPFITEELNTYKNYEKNKFTLSNHQKNKIAEKWSFAFSEFDYPIS